MCHGTTLSYLLTTYLLTNVVREVHFGNCVMDGTFVIYESFTNRKSYILFIRRDLDSLTLFKHERAVGVVYRDGPLL